MKVSAELLLLRRISIGSQTTFVGESEPMLPQICLTTKLIGDNGAYLLAI